MSATNAFETALLGLIFNNTNVANVGDATGLQGSTVAGSLYFSLHTADPGEAGVQTTSETNYTSYDRVAAPRSSIIFNISGNTATNIIAGSFPACTGGSSTVTHFGIGTADFPATGILLIVGVLDSPRLIETGITPSFAVGELVVTLD